MHHIEIINALSDDKAALSIYLHYKGPDTPYGVSSDIRELMKNRAEVLKEAMNSVGLEMDYTIKRIKESARFENFYVYTFSYTLRVIPAVNGGTL